MCPPNLNRLGHLRNGPFPNMARSLSLKAPEENRPKIENRKALGVLDDFTLAGVFRFIRQSADNCKKNQTQSSPLSPTRRGLATTKSPTCFFATQIWPEPQNALRNIRTGNSENSLDVETPLKNPHRLCTRRRRLRPAPGLVPLARKEPAQTALAEAVAGEDAPKKSLHFLFVIYCLFL